MPMLSRKAIDIQPGDKVLVHGAPSRIGYGERVHLQCSATVIRAKRFGRLWARYYGLLEFGELLEVGFEPREVP